MISQNKITPLSPNKNHKDWASNDLARLVIETAKEAANSSFNQIRAIFRRRLSEYQCGGFKTYLEILKIGNARVEKHSFEEA